MVFLTHTCATVHRPCEHAQSANQQMNGGNDMLSLSLSLSRALFSTLRVACTDLLPLLAGLDHSCCC